MPPRPATPLARLDYAVLQQCMHCAMCLPSCPTYAETGRERNSPRGRIALMRAIADGELATTAAFAEEMDYCLGCLACTSACPAGVDYAQLFEHARAHAEESGVRDHWRRRFLRWMTLKQLFTHPRLLRFVGRLLWIYQASGLQTAARKLGLITLLPRRLRTLEPMTPVVRRHFSDTLIRENEKPTEPFTAESAEDAEKTGRPSFPISASAAPSAVKGKTYRVALLTGCVQDLVFSEVNRATADVLLANGCEVVTPRLQHCCGSLHAHNGDLTTARVLARKQLDAIDPVNFDAIISNAAGCGSHLKHYDRLLADEPAHAVKAAEWSLKVKDISEWLVEIGFRRPLATGPIRGQIVTYHEACHLCHGQKISQQPREILRAIPGVQLRECVEATWCCGAAGIYSITQPETAGRLLNRKLSHLRATGAETVATANPGCLLQIEQGARRSGDAFNVIHPVVLLAEAYGAEETKPSTLSGQPSAPNVER